MVTIDYRLPTGATYNWSLGAANVSERGLNITNGVGWVKTQIDANQPAIHAPSQTTHTTPIAYHLGDYAVYAMYNWE